VKCAKLKKPPDLIFEIPQMAQNAQKRWPRRSTTTPNQAIAAIQKHRGVLADAALALGMARSNLARMARDNSKVARAVAQERDKFIDFTEKKLAEKVEDGNIQAIIFTLSTIGRVRGWVMPKDSTLAIGDTNSVTIQNVVIKAVPHGHFMPLPDAAKTIEGTVNRGVVDADNIIPVRPTKEP
jgi:hypothetical protein